MVRRGARAGRGRGRENYGRAEIDGQTASDSEESIHSVGQAPVQGVDPAALRAIVLESLREILGQGQFQISAAGHAPGAAIAQAAGVQHPPPPPRYEQQVQMPAYELRHDYWNTLKMMRDFGTIPFSGGSDPIAADNWRKQLERNFVSVRCPLEYKREIASSFLLEEAQVWWEGIEREVPPGYVIPWDVFREEFTKKYFPQETINELRMEFLTLSQENRTVREYEREFSRLRRFAVGAEDEQSLIQKFMMGLRLDIRKICQIRDYRSLIELVEKASMTEKAIDAESKLAKSVPQRTTRAPDPPRQQQQQHGNQSGGQARAPMCGKCGKNHTGLCLHNSGACYKCGRFGHHQRDCNVFGGTCNTCGKYGHRARDCRVRTRGPEPANRPREQLPPPPKRPAIAPRAYVAGDHAGAEQYVARDQEGAEPIAGKFKL